MAGPNATLGASKVLKGYLKKSRFDAKHAKPRNRFVVLDVASGQLWFHETEGKHCYKKVPLEEIERVCAFEEKSFLITMREVATSEKPGSTQRFDCADNKERDLWIKSLENNINGDISGLVLTRTAQRISIHAKYDCSVRSIKGKCNILGSGMSGDVRRITRLSDGHSFAMKTVNLSGVNSYKIASLRREIDILKSLDHPHISRLHETFIEQHLCVRLVMELCEGGELYARLLKKKKFSESYTCRLVTKMLKALNYLHQNNVVHRDLKLENWLFRHAESIDDPEDDDIVLIDFGLSNKYKDENEKMTKKVGTCYYVAPEVLKGSYSGGECDMWSLGVICFMLLSGKAPFDGRNDEEVRRAILKGDPPQMPKSRWSRISDEGKDFVKQLLERDVDKRLTAEEALKHEWISSGLERDDSIHAHAELEDSILYNLKRYSNYHELKRLAMEVIAFSLDHDEIKDLTELFEEIDQNCCGTITSDDLFRALQNKSNISKEEVRNIFNAMDEGGMGRIHVSEFVAGALQAKYHNDETILAQAFDRFDIDKKGKITVDDLKKLLGNLATEERIERIMSEFKAVNQCSDDEITFDDFMKFMRTDGEKDVNAYTERKNKKGESTKNKKQKPSVSHRETHAVI